MERVLADPRQLGFAQFDAFVLESRTLKAESALTVVRQDDVRECVFCGYAQQGPDELWIAGGECREAAVHPSTR